MKAINLKKAIACLTVALSVMTIAPIAANAEWRQSNGGWWFATNGGYYSSGWYKVSGQWYYFNSAGYCELNKWIQSGSKWYYVGPSGNMLTNQYIGNFWVNSAGEWSTPPTNTSSNGRPPAGTGSHATVGNANNEDTSYMQNLNKNKK